MTFVNPSGVPLWTLSLDGIRVDSRGPIPVPGPVPIAGPAAQGSGHAGFEDPDPLIYFNGIDIATGEYLNPPTRLMSLFERLGDEWPPPEPVRSTRHETRNQARPTHRKRSGTPDPHQGQFGGSPMVNDRMAQARLRPHASDRAACDVELTVRSTNPEAPLSGHVRFYLHPTFGPRREYDVDVAGGVARDTFTSWGTFTLGAVADEGRTRLELDLARVPGGTPGVYQG